MRSVREWLLRLIGSLRRRRADADLQEELRAHLDLAADDARRRHRPDVDAERAARLRAGGVSQAMDALRDQRGLPWLDALTADLKRMPKHIVRHRGYFAFATATLSVAVGANLIVFTIVNALWLRPIPFANADRLVTVTGAAYAGLGAATLKPFEAVAGQVRTDLGPFQHLHPELVLDRVGHDVETLGVTADYFRVLGLAIRGRDFAADDDKTGAEPVAIISNRLWARAFDRRDDAIGAVAAAKPFPLRIIGVAPPDFSGARRGERADVWIPSRLFPKVLASAGQAGGASPPLMAFARMHPGQTPAGIMRDLRQSGAPETTSTDFAIVPLTDVFGSPESRTSVIREGAALGVVSGVALLVLVAGCATLSALVLVHYERRRRELAVRVALGASRARLASGLIRELVVLAGAGTFGAALISVLGLSAMPLLTLPGGVDLGRLDLSMDWRVLVAAIAATVVTLVAATCLPVGRFTRGRVAGELLAGPAATASASSQRVRQILLALHVSATIVVLVAAGLFVRAVIHGFGRAAGFDTTRTIFATISMPTAVPPPGNADPMAFLEGAAKRTASLANALRAVPGVDAVAVGFEPIGPDRARRLEAPAVVQIGATGHELRVAMYFGGPELLQSLGVPILAGRALTADDATGTANPPAGIITASLAQRLWPNSSPIGQVVSLGGRQGRAQIVGVARDFAYGSMTSPAEGVIVIARPPGFGNEPRFVIHAAHVDGLIAVIRTAVADVLPGSTVLDLTTGRDLVARDLGRQRLGAWFFSGFGLTALILGVGGVFGLVAYLAESRRREYGVRLAMGAAPSDLVRHGLATATVPVALGVVIGLTIASIVAHLFASLLVGLSALDPLTYVAVAATMLMCSALAGLAATWRLRRLAPIEALRIE